MTVFKESASGRPASQHRHSANMAAGSLPKTRPHSQSLSAGAIHSANRIMRRKSMSCTPAPNAAAIAVLVKGVAGAPTMDTSNGVRRPSKPVAPFRGPGMALTTELANSVPGNRSALGSSLQGAAAARSEAVTDGPSLASMAEHEKSGSKSRIRRASEGSRLSKGEVKRANSSELKCEKCGKGYKHSSCLTKHLWEHTPEWQYTSKLLISKHQQVQLLEAASVLVAMNKEIDIADSDHSSPAASASSDPREDSSSTETTPPPQFDNHAVGSHPHSTLARRPFKRYSSHHSAYSPSCSFAVSPDHRHAGPVRQRSHVSDRPRTPAISLAASYYDDTNDQADLAAAVGLLSCSYGTPTTAPLALLSEVPPVPPLPSQFFASHPAHTPLAGTTVLARQSSTRNNYHDQDENQDVGMDDDRFADEDDYPLSNSHGCARIDEDEYPFFGRMEE